MKFDPQQVWLNARKASTEDLLDRLTVHRAGMEPEAIDIIEAELRDRGISRENIQAHARACEEERLKLADGTSPTCRFCRRPAVVQAWGWHRLWGKVPVFPRPFYYCKVHRGDL